MRLENNFDTNKVYTKNYLMISRIFLREHYLVSPMSKCKELKSWMKFEVNVITAKQANF